MRVKKLTVFQRRVAATSALCGSASALWILPPALLPFSDVTPMLVVVGVAIPAGVAGLFWGLTYDKARDLASRTSEYGQAEDYVRVIAALDNADRRLNRTSR